MNMLVSVLNKAFSPTSLIRGAYLALLVLLGAAIAKPDVVEQQCSDWFSRFSPDPKLNRLIRAIVVADVARVRKILTSRTPDLNHRDSTGLSALRHAITTDQCSAAALVQLLIDHGADVNLADHGGTTPLVAAVAQDKTELVRLLLSGGADPNLRRDADKPPLHFVAASDCGMEIATLLLTAGADPNARDAEGHKASDDEHRQEHAGLAYLLDAAERTAEVPVRVSARSDD